MRRRVYPLIAVLLAQGAPLGLLFLRSFGAGRPSSIMFMTSELAADPMLYAYLSLSTSAVFAIFGFVLGTIADRLHASATSDSLTGLFNRRVFDERVKGELARAERYGAPLSLLLVDLDRLKALNDRHGHEAGDAALRMIAQALRHSSRKTDLIARVGGDEFAVVAPETGAREALELGDRIHKILASMRAPWDPEHVVTVSIGIADLGDIAESRPEALLAAADSALYAAKSSGRNRSSTPPQPSVKGSRSRAPSMEHA